MTYQDGSTEARPMQFIINNSAQVWPCGKSLGSLGSLTCFVMVLLSNGWFMDGFVALINESPRLRHQKSAIYKTASLVCSDLAKNRVRLGNPARLTPNMADNRNPADHFKDVSTWLNPVHFVLIFFMD